jgi:hypothetical protein
MEKRTVIDGRIDPIEEAKQTALTLMQGDTIIKSFTQLFDTSKLEDVEAGVRQMNSMADKCWLLSALVVYAVIYNENMYTQSGLTWEDYAKQTKDRLGLEHTDLSEQLTAARFFIKYHKTLLEKGWKPEGSRRKLARAELALRLSKSSVQTINHVVNDTWAQFHDWYSRMKFPERYLEQEQEEAPRNDIKISKSGKITVGGIEPVKVSEMLTKQDKDKLDEYLLSFFSALREGYYPAIIPTYNKNEAKTLIILRDKRRGSK